MTFSRLVLLFWFFLLCSHLLAQAPMLRLLSPKETGVDFENKIRETEELNVLSYEYFYNGGGVAIGDLNNDGLDDIYFTANMKPDKLYLNLGDLTFRDITRKAGLSYPGGWKTGVTMADVNADGWLDIYICQSGSGGEDSRRNRLYINNGDLTFTESARQYGLDDVANSTQAAFFDYDRDGDLDMYLLNHSTRDFKDVELTYVKKEYDPLAGDKLYANEGGVFRDVSKEAGIAGNPLGFGLGISIADVNNDHWPDIYISNDYREHDYLYINNGDGTFTDQVKECLAHISEFSMGNDIADINNDGLADIITLDMLPEDNRRQKLLQGPENYELHKALVENGFHRQYMRNMLQLNNGNGTFSEVGQLAGISNTDWSWAALFADLDNDQQKDLFITNGYLRDYTNKDFLKFWGSYVVEKATRMEPAMLMDLVASMPSTVTPNYLYRNLGGLRFDNVVEAWGLDKPVLSNGAAYADLDNDGDLELVTNNVNQEAFIYQNKAREQSQGNYLQVSLKGAGANTFGLGAKVCVYRRGQMQVLTQMPTRGFQSAVSPVLHFGTGNETKVDSLLVVWPNGEQQIIGAIDTNQRMVIAQEAATDSVKLASAGKAPVFKVQQAPFRFRHVGRPYNDFKRQPLIPFMLSHTGPVLAVGDVNGDQLEDLFAGGAEGQPGALFLQRPDGSFYKRENATFDADKEYAATDAVLFDADRDGDLDLYVTSGMYHHFQEGDALLADIYYLNDGHGNFSRATKNFPSLPTAKSCVRVADFDADGDPDLFIGGRVVPGRYPETPRSYILRNDGMGNFTEVTDDVAPGLVRFGMVTDAAWADVDGNGEVDLIVAGDWMPITVYRNESGLLSPQEDFFEAQFSGLWNTLSVEDLDGDGDLDLIAGNLGLNTQIKATEEEPAELVYADFDQNGSVDPFLCFYMGGTSYPYITRDELLDQIYPYRKKFTSYESYADATLSDILTDAQIAAAGRLYANTLETNIFENVDGRFFRRNLPIEAQFSTVHCIAVVDGEAGRKDILLLGNDAHPRLKLGRVDGNQGMLLKNEGDFSFSYVPQSESGLKVSGDVREAAVLNAADGLERIILGICEKELMVLKK